MYAFAKTIRNATHVRRYTIKMVDTGWEAVTEQDNEAVRRVRYDDWHRVERAVRRFVEELETLEEKGWTAA